MSVDGSIEAISPSPDRGRREVKFVSSAYERQRLLNWLRLHPARFERPYPPRWVNNVYFDTHDCAAFEQNLSGVSVRRKVRYRWYGSLRRSHRGSLEVKHKRNVFGWKLRYDVRVNPHRPGTDWRTIRADLRRALTPEGRLWIDANPMAVLINRYFRQYFLSANRDVRVTVDTRQWIWDQRHRSRPNLTRRIHVPDTMVVEIKFEEEHRESASRILHDIPLRLSRHSKYVVGVEGMLEP